MLILKMAWETVMVKTCLEWTEATLLNKKPCAKPLNKLIETLNKQGKLQNELISKVPDRIISKLLLNNKDSSNNVSSRLSKVNNSSKNNNKNNSKNNRQTRPVLLVDIIPAHLKQRHLKMEVE